MSDCQIATLPVKYRDLKSFFFSFKYELASCYNNIIKKSCIMLSFLPCSVYCCVVVTALTITAQRSELHEV
jgi:hypothetical protein